MSNEYVAVLAYAIVSFVAVVVGLVWQRYRVSIGRHLGLKHYTQDHADKAH